ncbi:MAG: ethanolamine utilization protein EutQ [Gammaproteobacteria bacterium]|nr:ethanolamine utilization protein EutQ [Gammaproteobacteria bacterium]MCY4219784.1 ethanolamine utilization protein EutQ [Gammaproteobacteria bacterium]MCY4275788.1 ethanolamine utilization protein EutQ [Gammaproteobacteria bacterium]
MNESPNPEKSSVRMMCFAGLDFAPRFEHGDMAKVAEICGADDKTQLGVGWVKLSKARIPWTTRYDEVITVFRGQLQLHTDGDTHNLNKQDSIWLPAGTSLVYEAENALIHYAIHPANWDLDT